MRRCCCKWEGAIAGHILAAVLVPMPITAATAPEVRLEEVQVTARKRVERLTTIPVSVSAFSRDDIDNRKLGNLSQVTEFAPNVVFDFTAPISGSSNSASVFIRGIGQTDYVPSKDPGVGIYLDGVYLARTVGSVLSLLDVDRVEVLRGPQGTLFGKNTIGGAISVITIKPDDSRQAELEVTLGSYDRSDVRGFINTPISNNLWWRLSFGRFKRDGHMRRIITDDHLGGDNEVAGRLAIRWVPSEQFIADIAFDYSHANEESTAARLLSTDIRVPASPFSIGDFGTIFAGQAYNVLIGKPPPCVITSFGCLPPLPDTALPYDRRWLTTNPLETYATGPARSKFTVFGFTASLDWSNSWMNARSITAFRTADAYFGRDPDGSPLVIGETEVWTDHQQFSQEVQLTGASRQGKLEWVTGIYYLTEKGRQRDLVPFADETFQYYRSIGIPIPNFLLANGPDSLNEIDSFAVYAEASYAITPRWALTAGWRWTEETRETISNTTTGGQQSVINPRASMDFRKNSGRVILKFSPNESAMIYVSYSDGFKSGGFNHRLAVPPPPFMRLESPTQFAPEKVENFEAGVKFDVWNNRAFISGAVFHADYDNIQVLVFDLGVPRTINAAEARIDGLELELQLALSSQWRIDASYGHLNAAYTRLDHEVPGAFGNPIATVPLTLDSRFVNTPEHSLTLGAQAEFEMNQGSVLQFRADARYRSDVANDAVNTPELIQQGFWLFSAGLDWTPDTCSCEVSLFGENLSNELYFISGAADSPGSGTAEAIMARPREWGVRFSYWFY